MRVEIDTGYRKITIVANDIAHDLATIDKWLKAIKVGREWLRKELEKKQP